MNALLQKHRDELTQALHAAAVRVEQLRGALMFCDQLLAECQGNGEDRPDGPRERGSSGGYGADPPEGE